MSYVPVRVGAGRLWQDNLNTMLQELYAGAANELVYARLVSTYTLTSTTSAQQLFDLSATGAAAIDTGTWEFECFFKLGSMGATSGNAAFSLAGSATLARTTMWALGVDDSNPTNTNTMTGSYAITTASNASIVTAATGTGMWTAIRGTFNCTAAGTIIPSVSLVTAAAAVVGTGSYFKAKRLSDDTTNLIGTWS